MVLYPNKLPESERVCSGICSKTIVLRSEIIVYQRVVEFYPTFYDVNPPYCFHET